VPTYEIRFARRRDGEGPRLTGIEEFMEVLTSLTTAASAVSVRGESTTYCFLLNEALTRVLAAVAIDSARLIAHQVDPCVVVGGSQQNAAHRTRTWTARFLGPER
jgi:hypothetical protein